MMEEQRYWRNTDNQWGLVSRLLHWVMAIFIIGMLAGGLYMANLPNSPFKFELYGIHKAIGVFILLFLIFRFVWRISQTIPTLLRLPQPQQFLAKISAPFMYLVLFIMPLSGIAMSQAGGHPISVFGWATLPEMIGKNPELGKIAAVIHQTTAWILIALIIVHILAAFYHQFCRKDYLLTRMWKKI
jgi:cytochrome b561